MESPFIYLDIYFNCLRDFRDRLLDIIALWSIIYSNVIHEETEPERLKWRPGSLLPNSFLHSFLTEGRLLFWRLCKTLRIQGEQTVCTHMQTQGQAQSSKRAQWGSTQPKVNCRKADHFLEKAMPGWVLQDKPSALTTPCLPWLTSLARG